jgi:hypothetical protein
VGETRVCDGEGEGVVHVFAPPDPIAGPNQFTLVIKCRWCGHVGSALWEETPRGRQLISLTGFYERICRKLPFRIETVCDSCDRAQPV